MCYKHRELMTELGNYVKFEKILTFIDTQQAQLEFVRFSDFFSRKSQQKSGKNRFFAQICVPHVRKSKFLFETTF